MKNLIFGVAFILGMMVLAQAIKYQKNFNRIVQVKGLSERKVKSDLAIWKISLSQKTNFRKNQYVELKKQKNILLDFFKKHEITNFEFEPISIAEDFRYDKKTGLKKIFFYNGQLNVTITDQNVDKIIRIAGLSDELLEQGATIRSNSLHFLFEGLNEIKSEMIKEATLKAKEAANSFAENAGSAVGSIQTASQGYFEIKDSGTLSQWSSDKAIFKKVRVVTNISFFIE